MLLVVTYDVETSTASGARRLRTVAKLCEKYGVRVQNSVFEIELNAAQLVVLKGRLLEIIDEKRDSVRFYRMGNSWQNKVEVLGKVPLVQPGSELILSRQPRKSKKTAGVGAGKPQIPSSNQPERSKIIVHFLLFFSKTAQHAA